ncbi:TetR/AcrR family transcriptional regulator [Streptomyces sp. TRM66268-LWL]|uniref:TetR/AcrR family transcriptional regulator n=1 Tax=Streptomyces polyasparticus TaxID=2767826 RepID=A0ABR7SW61_9ACTN|nr:TetR/AcrR family transcriptional regulator [Streptomyces polyasparticus]MBC9719129.1 TetR/AcrR family transcriptional regulator [Streptomyces polyasparticus]
MAKQGETEQKPLRKGMLEKRQAILKGARAVFGRDGYTRASIDAIAAEAGVSSRTLYNHFGDKEGLFRAVLMDSSVAVTTAQQALLERHFHKFRDPEADLYDLAVEWVGGTETHPEHFALVRQIIAEASRLPLDVLREWQRIGPKATRAALRGHLLEAGRAGLLAIDEENADRATRHWALFTAGAVQTESAQGALPLEPEVFERLVREGVELFLGLYGKPQS